MGGISNCYTYQLMLYKKSFLSKMKLYSISKSQTVSGSGASIHVFSSIQSKGPDLLNTTYYPKLGDGSNETKPWYIIDAEDQTLGRLSSLAASIIRGKTNPYYHPAMDKGSYVVVINAEKVRVTGKKYWNKVYFRHTQNQRSGAGQIGCYSIESFRNKQDRIPESIIEEAVFGMLPKGRLGKTIRLKHLKVFKGKDHPHGAQTPYDVTQLINKGPTNATKTQL